MGSRVGRRRLHRAPRARAGRPSPWWPERGSCLSRRESWSVVGEGSRLPVVAADCRRGRPTVAPSRPKFARLPAQAVFRHYFRKHRELRFHRFLGVSELGADGGDCIGRLGLRGQARQPQASQPRWPAKRIASSPMTRVSSGSRGLGTRRRAGSCDTKPRGGRGSIRHLSPPGGRAALRECTTPPVFRGTRCSRSRATTLRRHIRRSAFVVHARSPESLRRCSSRGCQDAVAAGGHESRYRMRRLLPARSRIPAFARGSRRRDPIREKRCDNGIENIVSIGFLAEVI